MSDKKNIDRIFQERFKDFEATPPPAAWDAIEKNISVPQKPKGFVVPLWLRYSGIAVLLLAILSLGSIYFGNEVGDDNGNKVTNKISVEKTEGLKDNQNARDNRLETIVDNEDNNNGAVQGENSASRQGIASQENNENTNATSHKNPIAGGGSVNREDNLRKTKEDNGTSASNKNNKQNTSVAQRANTNQDPNINSQVGSSNVANAANKTDSENTVNPINTALNNAIGVNKVSSNNADSPNLKQQPSLDALQNQIQGIASQTQITKRDELSAVISQASTIDQDSSETKTVDLTEVAASEKDDSQEDETIPFKKSWSGTPVIGPVYSSSLGGSSIGDNFIDNTKSAGFNVSYGILIGYNVAPRLAVRTGVHQVNMSYTTQDITYGVDVDVATTAPLAFNRQAVTDIGVPFNTDVFSQELVSDGNNFNGLSGELSQRLAYVEVPLEVSYRLIDRKISLNLTGGMSALFLTDNSVAVFDGAKRLDLGADSNFNDFHQSANLGLGLGYKFSDKLGAMIEPVFKYQLNTLKRDVADFRPYNLGLYTGITFTF
ncbi:MAG: hypothetical protein NWQ09_01820 [Nonlabens sp.]|nr:hypothetical protein [Nonlabens sp.]